MVNLSSSYSLIIAFGSNLRLRLATSTFSCVYVYVLLRRNYATNIAITLNCCTRDYYCYEL